MANKVEISDFRVVERRGEFEVQRLFVETHIKWFLFIPIKKEKNSIWRSCTNRGTNPAVPNGPWYDCEPMLSFWDLESAQGWIRNFINPIPLEDLKIHPPL